MSFVYTTEYNLGRRGRVCHTYSGVRALVAIALDLTLVFLFGLVGFGIWLVWRSLVAVCRMSRTLFSLPLRVVRVFSAGPPSHLAVKPAWASIDEL